MRHGPLVLALLLGLGGGPPRRAWGQACSEAEMDPQTLECPVVPKTRRPPPAALGGDSKQPTEPSPIPARIQAEIRRQEWTLKTCRPDVSNPGRIEIQFRIAGGGVQDALVVQDTTGWGGVAACFVERIRSWSFSPDLAVEVMYPWVFWDDSEVIRGMVQKPEVMTVPLFPSLQAPIPDTAPEELRSAWDTYQEAVALTMRVRECRHMLGRSDGTRADPATGNLFPPECTSFLGSSFLGPSLSGLLSASSKGEEAVRTASAALGQAQEEHQVREAEAARGLRRELESSLASRPECSALRSWSLLVLARLSLERAREELWREGALALYWFGNPVMSNAEAIHILESAEQCGGEDAYTASIHLFLATALSDRRGSIQDPDKARSHFERAASFTSQKEVAGRAAFELGEIYFDDNSVHAAIPWYKKATSLLGEDRLGKQALYKLAWSYYRIANRDDVDAYDQALSLFSRVLGTGAPPDNLFYSEAVTYTAISLADLADIRRKTSLTAFLDYYDGEEPPWFQDVAVELAQVLEKQARYEEAIELYDWILLKWPLLPKAPTWKARISQLYLKLPERNHDAAQKNQSQIPFLYGPASPWARANQGDAEALKRGMDQVCQVLAVGATNLHIGAQKSKTARDYLQAADAYRRYLADCPQAEDRQEMRWYLADAMLQGGETGPAGELYEDLSRTGGEGFQAQSLTRLVKLLHARIPRKYGSFSALPQGAAEERPMSHGDQSWVEYAMGWDHRTFVWAVDQLLARPEWQDVVALLEQARETLADPARSAIGEAADSLELHLESREQYRQTLELSVAQVLVAHGRHAEAWPHLERAVPAGPSTPESLQAAELWVSSLLAAGEYEAAVSRASSLMGRVRQARPQPTGPSKRDIQLLTPAQARASRERMASLDRLRALGEEAELRRAAWTCASGSPLQGARDLEELARRVPRPQVAPQALRNAAACYDAAGETRKALQALLYYTQDFGEVPDRDTVGRAVALRYAARLELADAREAFGSLSYRARASNPQLAAEAARWAALCSSAMGEYDDATRLLEGARTLHEPTREQVLLEIALAERSGSTRSVPCVGPVPVALECLRRQAEIRTARDPGDTGGWAELYTIASAPRLFARSSPPQPAGGSTGEVVEERLSDAWEGISTADATALRAAAREGELRDRWLPLAERFLNQPPPDSCDADLRRHVGEVSRALEDLRRVPSDTPPSAGEDLVRGILLFALADRVRPCAETLASEVQQALALPAAPETTARDLLVSVLGQGREQGRWTCWQERALQELSGRYPKEWRKVRPLPLPTYHPLLPQGVEPAPMEAPTGFHVLPSFEDRFNRALQVGDPSRSLRRLARLSRARPGDARALYALGLAYGRTGDFASATEVLLRSIELDRTVEDAWLALAASVERTEGPGAAAVVAWAGLEALPASDRLFGARLRALTRAGSGTNAQTEAARAMDAPTVSLRRQVELGWVLLDTGELDLARLLVELVEETWQESSKDPEFLGFQCAVDWALGEVEDARVAVDRALLVDPSNAAALFTLAQVRTQDHDWAGALEALDRVPDSADVRTLRGLVLHQAGRSAEARDQLTAAMTLQPHAPLPHLAMAVVLGDGRGDREGAQEALHRYQDRGGDYNSWRRELNLEAGP